MRLIIEIVAALLLVLSIGATGAAFAAGKLGRSADGLELRFQRAAERLAGSPLPRHQEAMWGKFYANYCGDKMLADR